MLYLTPPIHLLLSLFLMIRNRLPYASKLVKYRHLHKQIVVYLVVLSRLNWCFYHWWKKKLNEIGQFEHFSETHRSLKSMSITVFYKNYGFFAPLPVRPLARSLPGWFAPWLFRPVACSPPVLGCFAPWFVRPLVRSPPGLFAPGWFALLEYTCDHSLLRLVFVFQFTERQQVSNRQMTVHSNSSTVTSVRSAKNALPHHCQQVVVCLQAASQTPLRSR